MNEFFDSIMNSDFAYEMQSGGYARELNFRNVLIVVLSAALLGLAISLVYLFTHKKEGYSQAGKIATFDLNITRVDPEQLDGMTLEEWEGEA